MSVPGSLKKNQLSHTSNLPPHDFVPFFKKEITNLTSILIFIIFSKTIM